MFDIQYTKKPSEYSSLSLAYIGDAVYELYVRSRIVNEYPDMPPAKLHITAIKFVKASAQAEIIKDIFDNLSEREQAVFKRGRNAKSHTVPKNADVTDYRYATGFETLIGYLYLSGDEKRLEDIMRSSYEGVSVHIREREHHN